MIRFKDFMEYIIERRNDVYNGERIRDMTTEVINSLIAEYSTLSKDAIKTLLKFNKRKNPYEYSARQFDILGSDIYRNMNYRAAGLLISLNMDDGGNALGSYDNNHNIVLHLSKFPTVKDIILELHGIRDKISAIIFDKDYISSDMLVEFDNAVKEKVKQLKKAVMGETFIHTVRHELAHVVNNIQNKDHVNTTYNKKPTKFRNHLADLLEKGRISKEDAIEMINDKQGEYYTKYYINSATEINSEIHSFAQYYIKKNKNITKAKFKKFVNDKIKSDNRFRLYYRKNQNAFISRLYTLLFNHYMLDEE